jgi:hypothetical protein
VRRALGSPLDSGGRGAIDGSKMPTFQPPKRIEPLDEKRLLPSNMKEIVEEGLTELSIGFLVFGVIVYLLLCLFSKLASKNSSTG